MTWIMAYHDGNWHLTKHISVVSTSYCDSMYLACALAHSMELSALKFSPISFTLTLTQSTIHVLINLLYKSQDTPLHHDQSWPLLPIIFQKHHNVLKAFRTKPTKYLPHGTPSSSLCLLQAKAGRQQNWRCFFDLIPEIWEQSSYYILKS